MSPLGTLLIFFVSLLVLVVVGSIALLFVKHKIAYSVIFVILSVLTIVISVLGATSMARNYVFEQMIAWSWGGMALIALGINFAGIRYSKFAKYLLIVAAFASVIDLIFI